MPVTAITAAEGRQAEGGTQSGVQWAFAEERLRHVSVGGVDIQYRFWGDAPPGAPAMLFLHGFRAHSRWWDHIVPFFQGEYRVATMDFSGLGDSGWRERYTLKDFANEILAVIAAADIAGATVVAHSFGGSPAALATVIDPSAIGHLILIDSRLLLADIPDPTTLPFEAFKLGQRFFSTKEDILGRFRLIPPVGAIDEDLFEHIRDHSVRSSAEGWTWKFDPSLDPQLTEDALARVPRDSLTPTDFIFGERSSVLEAPLVNEITGLLRSCNRPIELPACNHHVMLEQPLTLVAVLRALLNKRENLGLMAHHPDDLVTRNTA